MNLIDFFIGLTLVNALPHFVLGVWKGRMLSLFGFGSGANIAYALLNLTVCLLLYHIRHGLPALLEDGAMLGALFVIVSYLAVGKLCFRQFHEKYWQRQAGDK